MYAVIETGGKQYKVQENDVIYVEKINEAQDSQVEFKVVACDDDQNINFGNPYIDSAKVLGKIIKSGKKKKITVFTYKPKKNCKRKMGHRQSYTKVQIQEIIPDLNGYV
ncbi:MAG: 50S ribosomal protein L21 [Oscillospiraceae bacterium]|jgi:large subunit ribosomal protein L21|nr:50S ribosomal protein L21 [Oscillospiraceae bacterium]